MATYKKSGNKEKGTKREKTTVEEQSTTAEVFDTLDESASKSEQWILANQQSIFMVIGAVVIAILGFLGFQKFVSEPNEQIAANELAFPKKHFNQAISATDTAKDSLFILGLEGEGGKFGFTDIADEYSGTDAGNLANYYAGISYLKLQKYSEAIEYLEKFESNDQALGPLAKGAIGDAFSDLNQQEDALDYYEQAAGLKNNEFTTPLFLFKGGNTALALGQNDKALAMFETIEKDYPKSTQAKDINIYISKAKYAN